MSLNGLTWLLIVGVIFVFLYAYAQYKENKNTQKTNKNSHQHGNNNQHTSSHADDVSTTSSGGMFNKTTHKTPKSSKALRKLHQNLEKNLPEFAFHLRQNHITMIKNNTKVAMITLDKDTKQSQRKLGDVIVLNYHKAPNHQQILDALPPSL